MRLVDAPSVTHDEVGMVGVSAKLQKLLRLF